jgi:hypothetical protein
VIACTLLVGGPPKLPRGTVPAGRFFIFQANPAPPRIRHVNLEPAPQ